MSKHVQKALHRMSKRNTQPQTDQESMEDTDREILRNQYKIIRDDVVKLKDDIQKGYDMAKGMVERRGLIGPFLKMK